MKTEKERHSNNSDILFNANELPIHQATSCPRELLHKKQQVLYLFLCSVQTHFLSSTEHK
ncbi:hypothetical protein CDG60_09510 [Acinetobacter chinensis]|uniref:Uncharacterized protein n=1 Tax=Acinetobacter chinensis TaxID=2004650 RepID=A0A3B7LV84_9GAMM|nr:hypothetical protein CDG60_09510 [Acinetobacter chinensis]